MVLDLEPSAAGALISSPNNTTLYLLVIPTRVKDEALAVDADDVG